MSLVLVNRALDTPSRTPFDPVTSPLLDWRSTVTAESVYKDRSTHVPEVGNKWYHTHSHVGVGQKLSL